MTTRLVLNRRTAMVTVLLSTCVALVSCSPTGTPGTITVSAAASLTEPFERIGDDFTAANPGVEVRFNFDSSGTLAKQIQEGATADGFASADEATMKTLTDPGLIAGTPTVFARNQLTIVVKRGNPKGIASLVDLPTAGTVSLCGAEVPCGRYADQILGTAHVTIPADKITRGQNAKATFAAVAEGDADAGIVYVTDVTGGGAGDRVERIVVPDAQNAIASYPIGVVAASSNPATMRAFIAYLLSPAGQATLQTSGFLSPP